MATVAWEGMGFVGLKIISFISQGEDGRENRRINGICIFFSHTKRGENFVGYFYRRPFNFFVSRRRATTRSSKLKKPMSRNDG